jgi:hypothetical protein
LKYSPTRDSSANTEIGWRTKSKIKKKFILVTSSFGGIYRLPIWTLSTISWPAPFCFFVFTVVIILWLISKVYWIDKVGNRRPEICDHILLLINYHIQVRVHQSESRHTRWMHKPNHTPLLHIDFPHVLLTKLLSITMVLSLNMDKYMCELLRTRT